MARPYEICKPFKRCSAIEKYWPVMMCILSLFSFGRFIVIAMLKFYIAKRWAGQDSTQAITHFPLKSKFTSWKVKKSILPNVGTTGQFWALLESSFGPKRIKRKMCIKYNQMIKVTNQQWFSMFKMTSSHHSSICQFDIFEYWESCQVRVGMINMCVWWCNQICHFGK